MGPEFREEIPHIYSLSPVSDRARFTNREGYMFGSGLDTMGGGLMAIQPIPI